MKLSDKSGGAVADSSRSGLSIHSRDSHEPIQVAPLAFICMAVCCDVLGMSGTTVLHSSQAQRTSAAPPTPTHLYKGIIVVQACRLALLPPAAHAAHACGARGTAAATQESPGRRNSRQRCTAWHNTHAKLQQEWQQCCVQITCCQTAQGFCTAAHRRPCRRAETGSACAARRHRRQTRSRKC